MISYLFIKGRCPGCFKEMQDGGKFVLMSKLREFRNSFGIPCLEVLTEDLLCESCKDKLYDKIWEDDQAGNRKEEGHGSI
jgi:hypothetical protein